MDNYERSIKWCKSIRLDPNSSDDLYLHALEVIGAISCIYERKPGAKRTVVETTKQRVFWKTIHEIAVQQLHDAKDENKFSAVNSRSATKMLLKAFPDKDKKTDGRLWLPMHFAFVVPNVDFKDIRVLFASTPKSITTLTSISIANRLTDFSVTPCHIAVLVNPPNLALIDHLKLFDRNFGGLLASDGSTPLHFAAETSNSVVLIQKLIQFYPQALLMRNHDGDIPLCCVAKNVSIEAPEILKALIHAAPHTISLEHNGTLPLTRFLDNDVAVDKAIKEETVLILLEAFPDAVNIPDVNGWLPIHTAADRCSVDILRIITEANPQNLSSTIPITIGSVAHLAVSRGNEGKIRYIHSIMPELFLTLNDRQQTPIQLATQIFKPDQIKLMVSLVPETMKNVDSMGNNLLHTFVANMTDGNAIVRNLIRLLLRLIPGGALQTNNQGQTPYDLLTQRNASYGKARRLLLLAGAPSLHPKKRKQMNYEARKGALLAFFAGAFEPNIFYRIREGRDGIAIMRQIVSFL